MCISIYSICIVCIQYYIDSCWYPADCTRTFHAWLRWKVIRKSVDAEPNQAYVGDVRIAATPGPGVANVAHHECTG